MASVDWIALLERSYDLAPPDEETWLQGLLEAAGPMFGDCLGLGAHTLHQTPSSFRINALVGTGPAELQQWGRDSNAYMPKPVADIMYRSGRLLGSLSQDVLPHQPEFAPAIAIAPCGLRDALGALGHAGDGLVVVLSGLYDRPVAPNRMQRDYWPKVSAHVAAALRLRRALRGDGSRNLEAVLSPSGQLLDATPGTKSARLRERLRSAVQQIDRARTARGRRDPDRALSNWRGLVAGRWSLVDRFDSDGKRFVVAVKNDPENLDPRGLHRRERQVAEFIGMGRSTRQVAYTLGLSESVICTYAASAQRKLGLASRAELATFFHPNGLRAHLCEATVAGEQILVGSTPLLDEECFRRLSRAERDVALLVLMGSTNADIAKQRGSSEHTVANQLQSVFRKLGVTSRVQLAALMHACLHGEP